MYMYVNYYSYCIRAYNILNDCYKDDFGNRNYTYKTEILVHNSTCLNVMNAVASLCILCVLLRACVLAHEDTYCPTWYHYNSSIGKCECGNHLSGGTLCVDPGQVYLRISYCMTLDNLSNMSIAGNCHHCHFNRHKMIRGIFGLLPNDSSQLIEAQCTPNHRQGLLCAKCTEGYGASVTSLTPKCVECTFSPIAAVLLYLLIELLPITVFFTFIVIFRINILSGPLMGYFIFCQAYAAVTNQLFEIYSTLLIHASVYAKVLLYSSYVLSSTWALCSFNILPPICISARISLMDAVAMKYVRVAYPLVLVPITYFLIELHARNFKPVVSLCRPFSSCLRKVNLSLSTNDSIIHAYATLYFLSFAALNYISFKLLSITDLIREDGTVLKHRLQLDPTVTGYTSTHAPYIVIAYGTLVLLGMIPAILLCLYPIGRFRNTLECVISQRKIIMLNTFVETLYSCYKDGLNGTRDYRYSLGIFMLLTIVLVTVNAHWTGHYTLYTYIIVACLLMAITLIVAYVRPCKTFLGNLSLSFHTFIPCLSCVELIVWMGNITSVDIKVLVNVFAVINFLPHFLVALWIGHKALHKIAVRHNLRERIGHILLPQRMVNLRNYNRLD